MSFFENSLQHLMTRGFGRLAQCQQKALVHRLIALYCKKYKISLHEAKKQSIQDYKSFNDFFTRELQTTARPINQTQSVIASPVDGTVIEAGPMQQNNFLIKQRSYALSELLGHDSAPINGQFLLSYLSPRDYHRIHMPLDGTLISMDYLPGQLLSVNPNKNSPGKWLGRNERLICLFDTPMGKMHLILIGALIVGSIETTWEQTSRAKDKQNWQYDNQTIQLKKGEEMGRFKLGSSVMIIIESDTLKWDVQANQSLKMGSKIGQFNLT